MHSVTFNFKPKSSFFFRQRYVRKELRRRSLSAGSLTVVFDNVANETNYVLDVRFKSLDTKASSDLQFCLDRTSDTVSFDYKVRLIIFIT